MIIITILCFAISSFCFGAEYRTTLLPKKNFRIPASELSDNKTSALLEELNTVEGKQSKIKSCLSQGRSILVEALKKNPIVTPKNLTVYDYKYNKTEDQYTNLVSAKVQITNAGDIALLWRFKNKPTNFNYKRKMYDNDWLDAAVSFDGAYVAGVIKGAQIGIGKSVNDDLEPLFVSPSIISDTLQKATIVWWEVQSMPTEYIICVSLNGLLLRCKYDATKATMPDVRSIIDKPKSLINDLSFMKGGDKNLIMFSVLIGKEKSYKFGNFVSSVTFKDDPKERFDMTCNKRVGDRVMLLDRGIETNGINTISTYDIAEYRGLHKIEKCLALDINVFANRVALVSTESREKSAYIPKVETADFIPTHMISLIKEFNNAVKNKLLTVDEASNLLSKIILANTTEEMSEAAPVAEASITLEVPVTSGSAQQAAVSTLSAEQKTTISQPERSSPNAAFFAAHKHLESTPQAVAQSQKPVQQISVVQQPAPAQLQPVPTVSAPIQPIIKPWTTQLYETAARFGSVIQAGFAWMRSRFAHWFGF